MSTGRRERRVRLPQAPSGSSRGCGRSADHPFFPLRLELRYRTKPPRAGEAVGTGRSLWISSDQILFLSDQPLEPGTNIEVSLAWPARLDNRTPLQLCVTGQVVRCSETAVSVRISRHEFRTRIGSAAVR